MKNITPGTSWLPLYTSTRYMYCTCRITSVNDGCVLHVHRTHKKTFLPLYLQYLYPVPVLRTTVYTLFLSVVLPVPDL